MGDKVNTIRVDCISAYASQNIMNAIKKNRHRERTNEIEKLAAELYQKNSTNFA